MNILSVITTLNGKKSYLGLGLYALAAVDGYFHFLPTGAHTLLQQGSEALIGVGVVHKLQKAHDAVCEVATAVSIPRATTLTVPRVTTLLAPQPFPWPQDVTPPVLLPLDPNVPIVTEVGESVGSASTVSTPADATPIEITVSGPDPKFGSSTAVLNAPSGYDGFAQQVDSGPDFLGRIGTSWAERILPKKSACSPVRPSGCYRLRGLPDHAPRQRRVDLEFVEGLDQHAEVVA